jgi:DNA-binding LacI/PurR family transcriptional regulator
VRKGIAFAVLGNNVMGEAPEVKYDAVFSDDVQGGKDMTRHMIQLGHRKICFIGNTRLPWFARCYSGYRSVMEEAGLEPIESSIDSENEAEIGYLGTKSLLARGTPVTAIFAGNDPTAQGVYKAMLLHRLDNPGDPPQQATIPTEFVSRDSCRPGPAAAEHDEVLQEVAG